MSCAKDTQKKLVTLRGWPPKQSVKARAQYPSLHFEAYAVKGRINQIAHPIYLPPLATSADSAKQVGGNTDVILTIPGLAGFAMKVKANSVTFPDGSKTGLLIVSPVTADKLPMSPPAGGATFGVPAWTIQPAGTRFDPPIEVSLPNAGGYPAGDNLPIVQWDHDLGQYVAMGRATVSEDGAVLVTDSGSGLTKAGWGGLCRYDPDKCGKKEPLKCGDCEKEKAGSGDCPDGSCVADPDKDGNKLASVNIAKLSFSAKLNEKVRFITRSLGVIWESKGEISIGPITGDLVCCSTRSSGKAASVEFTGLGGGFEVSAGIPLLPILKKLAGFIFNDQVSGPTLDFRFGFTGGAIRGAYDWCKNEGNTSGKITATVEGVISLANASFPVGYSGITGPPGTTKGEFRPLEIGVNGQGDWTLERWDASGISGPTTLSANIFGKSQISIGSFNVNILDISAPIFFSQGNLTLPVPEPR